MEPERIEQEIESIVEDVRSIEGEAHMDDHTGGQVHDLCLLVRRLCRVVKLQHDHLNGLKVVVTR